MACLLVIDDDDDFANAIQMVLSDVGYEVRTRPDIDTGLKSMQEKPPDLLVLDIMFPENNCAGLELVRAMRQIEKLKHIPILILSALNSSYLHEFSLNDSDGICLLTQDILEKPMDSEALKNKISEMLQRTGPEVL